MNSRCSCRARLQTESVVGAADLHAQLAPVGLQLVTSRQMCCAMR